VGGLEVAGLELDDHVGAELQVVEEQVEVEVLAADLEVDLAADEGEAGAELEQEAGDVVDQRALDVPLVRFVANAQEVEAIEEAASARRSW